MKKLFSGRNSEEAPLLADDAPDRDDQVDCVEEDSPSNGKASKLKQPRIWYQKSWDWLLHNLMAVAIMLLLLGGLIALIIYFAGAVGSFIIIGSRCLIPNFSHIRWQTSPKAGRYYLSHSGLRASFC